MYITIKYRKVSRIIRTFFTPKMKQRMGCVLYASKDKINFFPGFSIFRKIAVFTFLLCFRSQLLNLTEMHHLLAVQHKKKANIWGSVLLSVWATVQALSSVPNLSSEPLNSASCWWCNQGGFSLCSLQLETPIRPDWSLAQYRYYLCCGSIQH